MAITHSLDTLWIYPSGYSTLYLTHTHTCVPTKNGERPLAYTILIVHLHTLNTANSLPPTPKSGELKPISLPLTPKSGDLKPIYLNLHTQIIKSEEKIPSEFLKYHFLFLFCKTVIKNLNEFLIAILFSFARSLKIYNNLLSIS